MKLEEYKVWAVGTLRKDRIKCCLKSETELKKEGWDEFDECIDFNSSYSIVTWYDNKAIQLGFCSMLDIIT